MAEFSAKVKEGYAVASLCQLLIDIRKDTRFNKNLFINPGSLELDDLEHVLAINKGNERHCIEWRTFNAIYNRNLTTECKKLVRSYFKVPFYLLNERELFIYSNVLSDSLNDDGIISGIFDLSRVPVEGLVNQVKFIQAMIDNESSYGIALIFSYIISDSKKRNSLKIKIVNSLKSNLEMNSSYLVPKDLAKKYNNLSLEQKKDLSKSLKDFNMSKEMQDITLEYSLSDDLEKCAKRTNLPILYLLEKLIK